MVRPELNPSINQLRSSMESAAIDELERQRRQITCVGLRGMVIAGHSWSCRINSIKSISGRGDDAGAVYIPDGPDLRYQQST